jgi:thiol:disulfide interchange protein DsbA
MRRLAALCFLMGAGAAWAGSWAAPLPYREAGPFEEDGERVYLLFAVTCPFCRAQHALLAGWAATLPPPFAFEAVPLVAGTADISFARGYYAAAHAEPGRLALFVSALYALVQDRQADPGAEETYRQAAAEAGIEPQAFGTAWDSAETLRAILRARRIYLAYDPDATPALAIAGRYLLTAERTHGDYPVLLQLANGLLSRLLQGQTDIPQAPEDARSRVDAPGT